MAVLGSMFTGPYLLSRKSKDSVSIEFSDDLAAVSVDSKTKTVVTETTYTNNLQLMLGNQTLEGATFSVVSKQVDGASSSSVSATIPVSGNTLTVTVPASLKVEKKITVIVRGTSGAYSTTRSYTIVAVPLAVVYQITSNVPYIKFDHLKNYNTGLVNNVVNATLYDSTGSTAPDNKVPSGHRVRWVINNETTATIGAGSVISDGLHYNATNKTFSYLNAAGKYIQLTEPLQNVTVYLEYYTGST